MMNEYKGYSAKITFDDDLGVFHGEVLGLTDVVTFEGKTIDDLRRAFGESVDDYLAFCKERGEEPDKPYSGRFVVRVSPELHRKLYIAAKQEDLSMNDWIASALEDAIERKHYSIEAALRSKAENRSSAALVELNAVLSNWTRRSVERLRTELADWAEQRKIVHPAEES